MPMNNKRKIKSHNDLVNYKRELRLEIENKEALINADVELLKMRYKPSNILDRLLQNIRKTKSEEGSGNILPGVINIVATQLLKRDRSHALRNITKGVGSLLVLHYGENLVSSIQSFVAAYEQKA